MSESRPDGTGYMSDVYWSVPRDCLGCPKLASAINDRALALDMQSFNSLEAQAHGSVEDILGALGELEGVARGYLDARLDPPENISSTPNYRRGLSRRLDQESQGVQAEAFIDEVLLGKCSGVEQRKQYYLFGRVVIECGFEGDE